MSKKSSWNEIPCPECKKSVAFNARKCPFCQTEYSEEVFSQRNNSLKVGMVGCGAFVLLLVLFLAFCSGRGDDPEEGSDDPKFDAIVLYGSILEKAKACDSASVRLLAELESGDEIASYRSADLTSSLCLTARQEIDKLSVPESFDDERRELAREALDQCIDAYAAKFVWADTIKDGINGDISPSILVAIEDSAQSASLNAQLCVIGLFSIAKHYEVSDEELGVNPEDDS